MSISGCVLLIDMMYLSPSPTAAILSALDDLHRELDVEGCLDGGAHDLAITLGGMSVAAGNQRADAPCPMARCRSSQRTDAQGPRPCQFCFWACPGSAPRRASSFHT